MNHKHTIFIKEYVLSNNATQSAKKAGYSEHSAHITGYRLLKNAEIQRLIEEEFKKIANKYEVTEDRVRKELIEISKENGAKASDRVRCWELLGKALGMFRDNVVNVAILQNIDSTEVDAMRKALRDNEL